MRRIVFILSAMLLLCSCSASSIQANTLLLGKSFFNENFEFEDSVYEDEIANRIGDIHYDYSHIDDGYFGISAKSDKRLLLCLYIDDLTYIFEVPRNGDSVIIPLQSGSRIYTYKLFEHLEGIKYKRIFMDEIEPDIKDEFNPFIVSNGYVKFDNDGELKKVSDAIAKISINDVDYVKNIIEYVKKTVSYNRGFVYNGEGIYISNPEKTLQKGKGVCIDYAVLTAALLRIKNIPTKVIVGHVDGYDAPHAWNEIYIDNQWFLYDITFVDGGIRAEDLDFDTQYHAEKYY